MTNEQYYWVRRQQMLHAFAMRIAAGEFDDSIKADSEDSLRKAFDTVKDGGTVKLTAPIALADGNGSIVIDKNVVVDLNGQTVKALNVSAEGKTKDTVFAVKRGGRLTVKGAGSVDGTGDTGVYSAVKMTILGDGTDPTMASLVVDSGTFSGKYYAISGNGNRPNTDVTINGGTFAGMTENDSMAVFQPQNGNLIINGGTFKGGDCIVVKAGRLVINGGMFTAEGVKNPFVHNDNGWNPTGDCIIVEACNYPGGIPSIEISGGTFYSANGQPVASYSQDQVRYPRLTKFVKGGTFNKQLDPELIADGYVQVKSGDMWEVKKA